MSGEIGPMGSLTRISIFESGFALAPCPLRAVSHAKPAAAPPRNSLRPMLINYSLRLNADVCDAAAAHAAIGDSRLPLVELIGIGRQRLRSRARLEHVRPDVPSKVLPIHSNSAVAVFQQQ